MFITYVYVSVTCLRSWRWSKAPVAGPENMKKRYLVDVKALETQRPYGTGYKLWKFTGII